MLLMRPALATRLCSELAGKMTHLLAPVETHAKVALLVLLLIATASAVATRLALRNPDSLYERARVYYSDREFEKAIALFEGWIATDRDTFKQATALYQLGASYSARGQHAAAVLVHERLRHQFPNVDYGAGTLFHLTSNYAELGLDDKARLSAAILFERFPDSTWETRLVREQPLLFGGGN